MNKRWKARACFFLMLVVALVACSSLRTSYVKPYSAAFAAPKTTTTARYVASTTAGHEHESGFRLLTNNNDALMSRVVLADRATRSIDLQYYIFDADATGRLIAQRLLAAADRGVRVRLLVDDLDAGDAEHLLDALDAHKNIEVRLFNPFKTRNPSIFSKIGQFVIDGPRLNRRMHNKSFIVDNTAAIIGGRNIGDAYFETGETQHFRDLDVIMIGPVVPEASRAFDIYWNDHAAYPVKAFDTTHADGADVDKLRQRLKQDARPLKQSDYASVLVDALPGGRNIDHPGEWAWGPARLVADDPQKVDSENDDPSVLLQPKLDAMIGSAQSEVLLISSYFVPGEEDTKYFTSLAKRGVKVRVLTNSLAATDEPLVHAGYSRYRRELLEGGVEVYELRPLAGNQPSAHGTSSGVSLHAKCIVVDRQRIFIGSMNMDQRSKLLNTEMGVVANSPDLASAVGDYFDRAVRPRDTFHVVLDGTGSNAP
ncbi:MAG TPA: phospholipase D family protein, partial [Rudaea sp.]|nr:phospholipase D family protein [Rudaea sp.]